MNSENAGYEVHPYSYSVSFSRPIERVGCVDYTDFKPYGYVVNGAVEISMTMNYKRDANMGNFKALFYNNSVCSMKIGGVSPSSWSVYGHGKVSEAGIDTGSPELRNTLTIAGSVDTESSSKILELTM